MWFNAAHQFELRGCEASHALGLWWGTGQAFAQSVTVRSPCAGGAFTSTAHRSPPVGGTYQAMVNLASSSHGAMAFANIQSH